MSATDHPECVERHNARTIPDRHAETCGAPTTCPGCLPCPRSHCAVCQRRHAAATCAPCTAAARDNLHEIQHLADTLPATATQGAAAYSPRGIPGGDALVMLAPGGHPEAMGRQDAHRDAHGLDNRHRDDEHPTDPPSVLAALTAWEDASRRHHHRRTGLTPTTARAVDYLTEHLAETLTLWPDLAAALAALRRRLENVTHAGERDHLSPLTCPHDGHRLARTWGATPEHDRWTCRLCGETYTPGEYDHLTAHRLASPGAAVYVPLVLAARAVRRPEQTIRNWRASGLIRSHRTETGTVVVFWPDVHTAHETAARRNRERKVE